jgi:hypothetical protein
MSGAGMAFPMFPEGKLVWLYRAHLWLQNSDRYDDHPSFHPVIHALELNSNPSHRGFKALLQALLIAEDSTFELIAEALNLPRPTVEAYDSLFFNMMDRREDFLYLQHVAYPNSRLEEMAEGYLENANLDQLLLRVAYNEGMAAALSIAGMKDNPAGRMSVAELTESLHRDTVVTGCKLAAAGFLKYEKQHPSIKATLDLIRAGKSKARAGGDGVTQGEDQDSFAEVLQGQLS